MSDLHERSLGRYRLLSLIGEGGMGKVYKGYDAALDRHVAIKVLPADLVTDSGRLMRFVREARAASALNHPHVVAVYDIGEAENVRYIAMELVDGKTLRELTERTPLDLRKAIRMVMQVAEALTAAHGEGIVHRDLKPDNIMITSAGYAKVLDFGLAKLTMAGDEPAGETSSTMVRATESGTVMGTTGYMSPEQAQGKAVDHRSDIFSLGCVLYELVAGRRAFHGNSVVDTLHKTIYADPEPVRALRPDVPNELIRILRKTLAKEPDERYQTARDLAIDLRELLREIDSDPGSDAITVPAEPARSRTRWLGAALLVATILVIAGFVYFRPRATTAPAADTAPLRIARVTASGKVISAAISPDGRFVAYVVADQGEQALWVRQMSSGQSLQLIPPQRSAYWGLAFGPDGSIYFGSKSNVDRAGAIYQISALGGVARKIITDIDCQPTFSPDGKRMSFLRARSPSADESSVIVANSDGTEASILTSVRAPEFFVPLFFAGASWSPDGKLIATAVLNRSAVRARIVAIDVSTGDMTTIAEEDWIQVAHVAWMPDGGGLVAIAQRAIDDASQVWHVTYPEGKVSRITSDFFDYRSVSLTADGRSLLTVAADVTADLWMHAEGEAPKRLTAARMEGGFGVDTTQDGGIVFTSLESGKLDIWRMNADGTGRTLLTRDEHENRSPVVAADGTAIVYVSLTATGAFLCRINADGTGRRVLAPTHALSEVDISPDGRWVLYEMEDLASGRPPVVAARISIDGGAPQVLTEQPSTLAAYSPDGSRVALYLWSDGEKVELAVIPAAGGAPIVTMDVEYPFFASQVAWSADGEALIVNTAPSDRANLWLHPLDGSPPRRLTEFDERLLMAFAPLPGGQGWVLSRGDISRDAVLITGFAPP